MRYYNVHDYGQFDTPANTTDAIHAAIAAANANGGGRVYFPNGVYEHTGIVCRNRNILLQGESANCYPFGDLGHGGGVRLKYVGVVGGIAVDFGPLATETEKIYGGGIHDLVVDGNGLAYNALRVRAVYNATFERLGLWHATFSGLHLQTSNSFPDFSALCYRNTFRQIMVKASGACNGILLNGLVAFCDFYDCHVTWGNGIAFHINNCDDCHFYGCAASRLLGGTGVGLYFGGSSNPANLQAAVGNMFFGFLANGGVGSSIPIVAAGGSFPSQGNVVWATAVDGKMPVSRATGAKLYVHDVGGYNVPGSYQVPPTTVV